MLKPALILMVALNTCTSVHPDENHSGERSPKSDVSAPVATSESSEPSNAAEPPAATAVTNEAAKEALTFPLNIADTTPDDLPWKVAQRRVDGDVTHVAIDEDWRYNTKPTGHWTISNQPLFVDNIAYGQIGDQWRPENVRLVAPLNPSVPYQKWSASKCAQLASQLTELARFFEGRYKDKNATAPVVSGFFSADCTTMSRNLPSQVWQLERNGMKVAVSAFFEHRTAQVEIRVEYATDAQALRKAQEMEAYLNEEIAQAQEAFEGNQWPRLPFGRSMDLSPDDLPWSEATRRYINNEQVQLVLLSGSKDSMRIVGETFKPHAAVFVLHENNWKLAQYIMMASFHNNSPSDCHWGHQRLQVLVRALESKLKTDNATITRSNTLWADNCKILRLANVTPKWSLVRGNVQVDVSFYHYKGHIPGDRILLEYTALPLKSLIPAEVTQYR